MNTKQDQAERLESLARIAEREADLLQGTAERLFAQMDSVTPKAVEYWIRDELLAERLDAFVARFSRLQDTLGDKLVPALLAFLGERRGPAMDNLDKAERFGWLDSADNWLAYRRLRNQMVHEYIDDAEVLAQALEAGRQYVPVLVDTAHRLITETRQRLS